MADRYQDRPFPADDDYDRGGHQAPSKGESDPLAELARLIGQTDPFANLGRANQPLANPPSANHPLGHHPLAPRAGDHDSYHQPEPEYEADDAPAGPPPWMQRAAAHEPAQPEFDDLQDPQHDHLHPVQRYAAQHGAEEQAYHQAPSFAAEPDYHEPADPNRYDDALYGQLPSAPNLPEEPGYDDPYAYQDDYDAASEDQGQKSRRGGMITVAVVLALAVVGTGAAFAYRTYVGSPRSGEPPIIKADPGPNKVIPAPQQSADASGKLIQDRMAGGGTEKLVSREEAPIDPSKAGPRVVFPPLNQNANPPAAASVSPNTKPPAGTGNGTLGGDEPRKIRTFSVRGDQPDPSATPVAKPAPAARAAAPAQPRTPSPSAVNANASTANAPMSLSPQAAPPAPTAEPHTRVASTLNAPQPITPPTATSGGSGYMVQVSSQKNEADAQASYRSLQGKYPSMLGSRSPQIKRADLGEKGVFYRAMVGPFGSLDEASQFCGTLKSAGGQCVIQRN